MAFKKQNILYFSGGCVLILFLTNPHIKAHARSAVVWEGNGADIVERSICTELYPQMSINKCIRSRMNRDTTKQNYDYVEKNSVQTNLLLFSLYRTELEYRESDSPPSDNLNTTTVVVSKVSIGILGNIWGGYLILIYYFVIGCAFATFIYLYRNGI